MHPATLATTFMLGTPCNRMRRPIVVRQSAREQSHPNTVEIAIAGGWILASSSGQPATSAAVPPGGRAHRSSPIDACFDPERLTFWWAMSEPWVSVDEVSGHLGVAKDTIYRWIETRDLPAHRVGRLWKFKLSEVDAWVQRGGADDSQRSSSSKKRKKSK